MTHVFLLVVFKTCLWQRFDLDGALTKKKRFKTFTQEGFSCTNYVVYLLWSSLWQFKQEDDAEKAMQDAKAAMRIQVTAEVRIAQERRKLDRERVNVCV